MNQNDSPARDPRGPAGSYSLGETAVVMAALSVLPLALLAAAAAPPLALGVVAAALTVAAAPRVARLVARMRGHRRLCLPRTEVCTQV